LPTYIKTRYKSTQVTDQDRMHAEINATTADKHAPHHCSNQC